MKELDWDSIGITDNLMFGTVFRNEDLCRELLEAVLEIPIGRIVFAEREKDAMASIESRGIRMDVFACDGSGRVYDVEMENRNAQDLMRRSRYYQSQLDLDCLRPGTTYEDMRDAYVIFICNFDPFGKGRRRYTITPHIRELKTEVCDGATRVFLSTLQPLNKNDKLNDHLNAFLNYALGDNDIQDTFVSRVDQEVRRVRSNSDWRHERMRLDLYVAEERALAHKEGLKEGREEGREEGLEQGLERGRRQGLEQGRERSAKLARMLCDAGRMDEVATALADQDRYRLLLKEFNIT